MTIRTIQLPSGEAVPALGLGTRNLGGDPSRRVEEILALQLGLDLGMRVIDTAEMFLGAEELVAHAIAGRRDECFIVDKVLPNHATRRGMAQACEGSLRRLVTDHIDLYLLHWRGSVALDETVEAFEDLVDAGKIRYWGVSNFHVPDLEQLFRVAEIEPQTNQVLVNLMDRGAECDVLPWCRRRDMPIMGYAPLDEGRLVDHPAVRRVAHWHEESPAAIALAWVLRNPDVIVTPRAGQRDHVRENRRALDIRLTVRDLRELENVFEVPAHVHTW